MSGKILSYRSPALLLLAGITLAFTCLSSRGDEGAKAFKPDDEGFIRNWLVFGPVKVDDKVGGHDEASCKEFLDKEWYPGFKDASPKEGDKATVDGKEAAWKPLEAADYSLDLAKAADGGDTDHTAYLGVVYVSSEKEVPEAKLAIGSDDDSVWHLNGKEVVRAYAGRAIDKDQDKSEPVTLKQGVNKLTFVVLNGDGPTAAAARFLDKDGNPIKGLTVSLTPPAK